MENNETTIEDTQILNTINKRLKIIEKTNRKISKKQTNQREKAINQKINQQKDINEFREECENLTKDLKQIKKTIFEIGKQLRDKTTNKEFEQLKKTTDEWPLEKYITKKELNKTYEHYKN